MFNSDFRGMLPLPQVWRREKPTPWISYPGGRHTVAYWQADERMHAI